MPFGIDALRVAFEFHAAGHTFPDILEVDVVGMLGCNFDPAMLEQPRAFPCPGLEFLAMRVARHATDHEIGEMTELMCNHIQQPMFVIYHLLSQLDGGVVSIFDSLLPTTVRERRLKRLPPPRRSSSSRIQLVGPRNLDTPGGGG